MKPMRSFPPLTGISPYPTIASPSSMYRARTGTNLQPMQSRDHTATSHGEGIHGEIRELNLGWRPLEPGARWQVQLEASSAKTNNPLISVRFSSSSTDETREGYVGDIWPLVTFTSDPGA
ncbi:uncharacterized protein BDCG_01798 [Blastomyces dermatitidis ER-3]|uniref:Uncharacterized protein n=2 Tax=Ajellomyces dermatitidis TaxID=5039 RepID=F2TLU4_AJEDA|nr:uncharacterized protein BDCG_01798 [Blastomyces dermatitidis ER-3]EEQ86678.1 hypothetical protein BDCG_01798 [Blastomyces dermatitidis ER-3]EGE84207.1 hypothetical protein BDDG_07152 [Blastomyces dermatitidis ATCC 18188]